MRFVRMLTLVAGAALPALETWRRWGPIEWWPSLLDDWLIGGLLLAAWWMSRGGDEADRRWLAGAWGAAIGIGYASFFGHLRMLLRGVDETGAPIIGPDLSGAPHAAVVAFKGIGLALAVVAFVVTLTARPRSVIK